MYDRGFSGTNRSLAYRMRDTLQAFGSSAKQAFNTFVRFNSPGFNAASELGLSPGYSNNVQGIIQLSGGDSSPFRLPSSALPSGGGIVPSESPAASPTLDYYQAALASHYGMDATTAYQEALANTSYQRSVQDMMDAGLNPSALFAAGRVSGAQGVSYATQLGSGFVGSGSSGGGSARSKYVFNKGLYQALQVVGGGLAVAATKHPSSYFAGQSAAKGVMQAINGFFR